jgi:phenylpyruvate tautomerase PptA (4-oxalocrotonate tautomerase family)
MAKRKKKKPIRLYDLDGFSTNMWLSLHEDFSRFFPETELYPKARAALLERDLKGFRSNLHCEKGLLPPHRFKVRVQLEDLLKRYRFAQDVFTDDELESMTIDKYLSTQVRLGQLNYTGELTHRVLQKARMLCKSILGEFPKEDIYNYARFGRKSSIGCPLSLAYIDHKLTDVRAFTGSFQCASWFMREIKTDPVLQEIVAALPRKEVDANTKHTFLNLVNVPKSWKIHRAITPLTLLDLFYSYGVGGIITDRLKEHANLDISRLQERHRRLVKKLSLTTTHATADLSSASDSITSVLLNRVLPRPWYNAVKMACTHQISINDKLYYTESVLPMGNGMTFPLETLVFYVLIKAIGELAGITGIFSVYGDDLIYPSKLHKFVARIFPSIGLCLNMDKTYVSYPFRESCGEDFYRGVSVRPFMLAEVGNFRQLTSSRYEAHIYKTINALLRRWDASELPGTLNYLFLELDRVTQRVLRVPPSFPDTSGIKVDCLTTKFETLYPVNYSEVSIIFRDGSRWFEFEYLHERMKDRFVREPMPYYWLKLSGGSDEPVDEYHHQFSIYSEIPKSPLQWKKITFHRKYKRDGKICTRRVKRLKLVTVSRESTGFQHKKIASKSAINRNRLSDWI